MHHPAAACPIWVIAACNGMASIFERNPLGRLQPLTGMEYLEPSLLSDCLCFLSQAESLGELKQCILIGTATDIAWMRALLSSTIRTKIMTEIEYPLIAGLFQQAQRNKESTGIIPVLERLLA